MLISNISRQCVLKMKDYSTKKTNSSRRNQNQSSSDNKSSRLDDIMNNSFNAITPLVAGSNQLDRRGSTNQLNDGSGDAAEDRSCLGRLLNCKPCRQVTENQKEKNVSQMILKLSIDYFYQRFDRFRKQANIIQKIVKQIFIGITKPKNFMPKLKKQIKYKKNWTIFPMGMKFNKQINQYLLIQLFIFF